jgi:hypothetical protein
MAKPGVVLKRPAESSGPLAELPSDLTDADSHETRPQIERLQTETD